MTDDGWVMERVRCFRGESGVVRDWMMHAYLGRFTGCAEDGAMV